MISLPLTVRRLVIWAALILMPVSSALGQNANGGALQPTLEVFAKQGNYYWVVATDPDGSRRGGWVSAQLIESIDTKTLRPVPAVPPQVVQPTVMPAIIAPNDFDGIVLALQNMRGKVSSAAATLEGLPDGITLRNRLDRIDQSMVLLRELAVDQNFGRSRAGAEPERQREPVQQPVVTSAVARHPQTRDGFWFSGGLGVGSLGCDNCEGRVNGLSGGLSLGGTIHDKWLLGVGTTGWARETLSIGTFDVRVRFYPALTSGFFITGGLGVGSISLGGESEIGGGAVFGIGWDVRIRSNVSLTPFYNGFAMRSSFADANVGQLGLNITFH